MLELATAPSDAKSARPHRGALRFHVDKGQLCRPRMVDKERELEKLFASRTITPQRLSTTLRQIGLLQAQVRDAHLEAHLAQVEILTPEQNARYVELRGYGAQSEQRKHPHRH